MSIFVGRVVKKISNLSGGWYLILTTEGRFRADSRLFSGDVPNDSIVSFAAESRPRRSKRLPKANQILSAPGPESKHQ